GQFAVRGGIIDIFSYANELPYRLELFGDEVESIRTFDPMTQLSKENKSFVSIIPNVQNKLLHESRESFLKFIPKQTKIWVKDKNLILNTLQNYFDRAKENFEQMTAKTDIKIISDPKILFESAEEFQEQSKAFFMIEFGKIFTPSKNDSEHKITYFETKPQPSFNKDFVLFSEHLADLQSHHVRNLITAESPKQLERLAMILAEIDPQLKFEEFNISLHEGFYDQLMGMSCYTDHQLFERFHRYRSKVKYSKTKSLTLKELRSLQVGDYVTHVDYGVGRFAGLEKVEVNGKHQESIRLVYRDDDLLYVSIHALHKIAKYSGKDGNLPTLNKLGSQEWEKKKSAVKRKVKDIAKELISLYAKRKNAKGFAFSKDTYLQAELESSFLYEDTPDQAKATFDVKNDMESPHPMDRLVCGDVGFGKTEIAIRAAFKATYDGRQVAVLVPTTILAMQHFKTFSERLKNFPCKVDYVNRFRTEKEIKRILKELAEGKIDVLIGTHRVVSQDVKFKNLGLLVIDEEQKFGVKTKERLKEMCVSIDSLTLTATPIPRTLHFSMMGARDLSVIATAPPNRQPVTTEIHPFNDVIIRDAISYEIRRGGQVFFVHNRIGDIEEIANIIMRLVPDAKICYAHGQMEGKQLEKIMLKFIEGEYDVMVSTNIIESGLDIPNANTIMINRAQNFGLSDLHQMRGRVGRSNRKAFCYLLVPMKDGLSNDSRKRLSALEEFSELGDGFKVAMRDLDIRGAGNLLGAEQSGFISDLGFEMYHQILDDAVQELKEEEFASLFEKELDLKKIKEFKTDCSIETDLEILIPEEYVSNISERLQLYSQADSVKDKEELTKFTKNLEDRFGKLPDQVKDLLKTVELRWLAEKIGFEKLAIKNNSLRASFVQSEGNDAYFQSESFGKVLAFVQTHAKECRLKELQKRLILIIENVKNIDRGIRILEEILG
ncbi:MAG: transcription-repair coupling factor, partial [Bacteroidetes bacterium]